MAIRWIKTFQVLSIFDGSPKTPKCGVSMEDDAFPIDQSFWSLFLDCLA